MNEELIELERELQEVTDEIRALDDELKGSRVTRYTDLVTRTGKLKGHLEAITPKQYERIIGRKPRAGLAVKRGDSTTKKIPYDLVLDQIADELGYHGTRGDEKLRYDIVEAKEDKERLEELKKRREYLINVIDDIEEQATKPEVIKDLIYPAPAFPDNEAKAEVVIVNGAEYQMRRQHSYWQLYKDDKPIEKERYATDARQNIIKRATRKAVAKLNFQKKIRRSTGRKRAKAMPPELRRMSNR